MKNRLISAKRLGECVVRDLNIDSLPIDPFSIAKKYDIVVEPKRTLKPGVSSMLLRHGNKFGIIYSKHVASEGFQHFSIGHELGHYFLPGHVDHVFIDKVCHRSKAGFVSSDIYEMEADHFSAGLLMPKKLFRITLERTKPGLMAIEKAAKQCKTSLTATAIRYVELTNEAIVIIVSSGKTVEFSIMSHEFMKIQGLSWIKKSSIVPAGSVTARFNSVPSKILKSERVKDYTNLMYWFGGDRSVKVLEEVVGLGSYKKTLTVLSCEPTVNNNAFDFGEI